MWDRLPACLSRNHAFEKHLLIPVLFPSEGEKDKRRQPASQPAIVETLVSRTLLSSVRIDGERILPKKILRIEPLIRGCSRSAGVLDCEFTGRPAPCSFA